MKKIFLALSLLVASVSSQAQLLWKISGNGLNSPSYVIGTHHLAPLSILESIPAYKNALDNSSQVIGELVMSDMQSPAFMQQMQGAMMISSDTTLQTLFTPAQFELVNQATKENMQLDLAMAPKLKPAFINMTMAVLLYIKSLPNYNPNEQLDTFFQTEGIKQGKKIIGLESPMYQMNILFNNAPLTRQAELLLCTLNNKEKAIEQVKELTDSYIKQDLTKMYNISQERLNNGCDSTPEEDAALIDNRNINWANELPAMIKDNPSFIAVGALHLPGENGLINLLRQKGYTVEPAI